MSIRRYISIGKSARVRVYTGYPVVINAGGAGQADQIAIAPPIPGLSAVNVQEAISELAPKEFSQLTPSIEWLWNHDLGFRPNAQIYNLAYQLIDAEVEHVSINQLRVRVNPAMPGFIII